MSNTAIFTPAMNLPFGWSYLGYYTDSVSDQTLGYASYSDCQVPMTKRDIVLAYKAARF